MNGKLVLIRGVPGSGKSTYAKNNISDYVNLEADMYFMRDGEYKYDPRKIKDAHRWCFNEAKKNLLAGKNVVVSNTFTRIFEMQNYIDFAEKHNIKFKVFRMDNQFKNIHGVPDDVLKKMKARFEDYPGEEIVRAK